MFGITKFIKRARTIPNRIYCIDRTDRARSETLKAINSHIDNVKIVNAIKAQSNSFSQLPSYFYSNSKSQFRKIQKYKTFDIDLTSATKNGSRLCNSIQTKLQANIFFYKNILWKIYKSAANVH